jgi:hypothetical protein
MGAAELAPEHLRRMWVVMDVLGLLANETALLLEDGPSDPKKFADTLLDEIYATYQYMGRTLADAGLWDTQPEHACTQVDDEGEPDADEQFCLSLQEVRAEAGLGPR